MATLRKKQCMVGQLAHACWEKFDYTEKIVPGDDSVETLETMIKMELEIAKKVRTLQDICEVDDTEMVSIIKAIIQQWYDRNNVEQEA